MDLVKEKKELPFIADFLVVREKSSVRSLWHHGLCANRSTRLLGKLSKKWKMEKQSSAGLWLNQQPSWKASCLNLHSDLPLPCRCCTERHTADTLPQHLCPEPSGSQVQKQPLDPVHFMKHIKYEL